MNARNHYFGSLGHVLRGLINNPEENNYFFKITTELYEMLELPLQENTNWRPSVGAFHFGINILS